MKNLLLLVSAAVFLFAACESIPESPVVLKTEEKNGVKTEYEIDTVKNVKHGVFKMYHADGKTVSIERQYKNDTLLGAEKLYHESGKLKFEASYTEGKYDGAFKEYFEDGKILQEGLYKADALEGEIKTYYPNGKLREKVTFAGGVENGPFEEYLEDGNIKARGTYQNGPNTEHCFLELYDESGSGEMTSKMICNGKGTCCTIWKKEEGEVDPTPACVDVVAQMKKECGQEEG